MQLNILSDRSLQKWSRAARGRDGRRCAANHGGPRRRRAITRVEMVVATTVGGMVIVLLLASAQIWDSSTLKDLASRPQYAVNPEAFRSAGSTGEQGSSAGRARAVDQAREEGTHREVEPLAVEFKQLTALRIREDNSLLAADAETQVIKVISPAGEQVGSIDVPFRAEAFDVAADGTLYCGGEGQLARLDTTGRVLAIAEIPDDGPVAEAEPPSSAERESEAEGELSTEPRRRKAAPKRVSGIAVSDRDVFVAFGSGWSMTAKSRLFQFDLQLENPKALVEGLRGCCQRCDIISRNGDLYVAENSAHRVVLYDREGNVLSKWGQGGYSRVESFGACCNPMNICFDSQGTLYTSEAGLGRVKRFTADGEFLGVVGHVDTDRFWHKSTLASACSNMAIAVTGDGQTVYVMDYKNNRIRVLKKKGMEEHVEAG